MVKQMPNQNPSREDRSKDGQNKQGILKNTPEKASEARYDHKEDSRRT